MSNAYNNHRMDTASHLPESRYSCEVCCNVTPYHETEMLERKDEQGVTWMVCPKGHVGMSDQHYQCEKCEQFLEPNEFEYGSAVCHECQ